MPLPGSASRSNPAHRAARAPAIYCRLLDDENGTTRSFRLPCPPSWDGTPTKGWAAERRARRAYFAALDALRTGQVADVERTKLQRFVSEVRHGSVKTHLEHLRKVFDFAHTTDGAPVLRKPERPVSRVELTVPVTDINCRPAQLELWFAWTIEWLRTRGYTAGRGLRIDWRLRETPASGSGFRSAAERRRATA